MHILLLPNGFGRVKDDANGLKFVLFVLLSHSDLGVSAPRAVRASFFRNCAQIVSISSKLCSKPHPNTSYQLPSGIVEAAGDLVYHLELLVDSIFGRVIDG